MRGGGRRRQTEALQGAHGPHTHSQGCMSEIAQQKEEARQIQINIIIKTLVINTKAAAAAGQISPRVSAATEREERREWTPASVDRGY